MKFEELLNELHAILLCGRKEASTSSPRARPSQPPPPSECFDCERALRVWNKNAKIGKCINRTKWREFGEKGVSIY
jgi:hypothetical protein